MIETTTQHRCHNVVHVEKITNNLSVAPYLHMFLQEGSADRSRNKTLPPIALSKRSVNIRDTADMIFETMEPMKQRQIFLDRKLADTVTGNWLR